MHTWLQLFVWRFRAIEEVDLFCQEVFTESSWLCSHFFLMFVLVCTRWDSYCSCMFMATGLPHPFAAGTVHRKLLCGLTSFWKSSACVVLRFRLTRQAGYKKDVSQLRSKIQNTSDHLRWIGPRIEKGVSPIASTRTSEQPMNGTDFPFTWFLRVCSFMIDCVIRKEAHIRKRTSMKSYAARSALGRLVVYNDKLFKSLIIWRLGYR